MKRLAPQEIRTFFITAISWGRRRIFQSEQFAKLFLEVLSENRAKSRFLVHEYVLMPNHFHLLITPAPEISLEKAAQFVKGGFSYRVKKELASNMEIWQPGFTEHRIKDAADYERHSAYIRNNPVRAKLVFAPEEYPYSSAVAGVKLDPAPPGLKAAPIEQI